MIYQEHQKPPMSEDFKKHRKSFFNHKFHPITGMVESQYIYKHSPYILECDILKIDTNRYHNLQI